MDVLGLRSVDDTGLAYWRTRKILAYKLIPSHLLMQINSRSMISQGGPISPVPVCQKLNLILSSKAKRSAGR
jgi:hypothetical protein